MITNTQASERILSNCLNEYDETPWTALKYLIGNVIYGGNVTDVWDKRLLDTYTKQLFNENAITTPFHKYDAYNTFTPHKYKIHLLYHSRFGLHVLFFKGYRR